MTRKPLLIASAAAALLGASVPALANPQAEPNAAILSLLFDQAQMWRERGRPDLAVQALQKIIASQPDNMQARFQLGLLYLQSQEIEKVAPIITKLREHDPSDSRADELERALRYGPADRNDLAEARKLAQAGQVEPAIVVYRRAFHGGPPPFELALEYYETLAGTAGGWDEARLQLKELATRNSEVKRFRFVYARTLTYSEHYRREGIAILAELCADAALGQPALDAMRQAMLWTEITSADYPFYEAYLRRFPSDSAIREKLMRAQRPVVREQDPTSKALAEAYRLSEAKSYEAAAQRFEVLIRQNPSNADAVAGLALVRLRQERFAEARDNLLAAISLAPDRQAEWAAALETASFWQGFHEALAARKRDDNVDAERILRPLMDRAGGPERISAVALMGDIMRALGRQKDAEAMFREVLRRDANHGEALAGLAQIMTAQGRDVSREPLLANLDRKIQSQLAAEAGAASAERARVQAKASEKSAPDTADSLYQQSMRLDPSNPWTRYDYAKFQRAQGRSAEAAALIDGLVATGRSEGLFAAAVFFAETQRTGEALALIDRIPAGQRSARMNQLRRDLSATGETDRLVAAARSGDASARATLIAKATAPQATPNELAATAAALARIGQRPQALAAVQRVMARTDLSGGVLEQLYRAASEAGDERLAGDVMARLGRTPGTRDMTALREGGAIRQADRLREQNNLAGAFDVLAPYTSGGAPSVAARLALARVYKSSNFTAEAMAVLDSIMSQSVNSDVVQEAIGIAIDLRSLDRAQAWLAEAMRLEPSNPRLYMTQSRLLKARGDLTGAKRALETAQELNRGGRPPDTNPLVTPPGGYGRRAEAAPPEPTLFLAPALPPPAPSPQRAEAPSPAKPAMIRLVAANAPRPQAAPTPALPDACDAAADTCTTEAQIAQASPSALPRPVVPMRRPSGGEYEVSSATTPSAPSGATDPLGREIERELETLKQQSSPSVLAGLQFRGRSGETGFGRLNELTVPLEARFPVGTGSLSATLMPVALSAGSMSNEVTSVGRYGTNQLWGTGGRGTSETSVTGVGIGVGFDWEFFNADIGTTPVGFATTNVVGGVSAKIPVGQSSQIRLDASRRAITDSVLSYSGVQDPVTKHIWGAVTRTGVDGTFSYDDGEFGAYGKFGYGRYEGKNVASNAGYELSAGAYMRPVKTETSELRAGVAFTYMSFDKNLGGYSFGQGGYFSPQSFYSLSFPVDWEEKNGRFKYNVGGTLGLQYFQKARSPYFPGSPEMQASADGISAADSTRPSYYESSTTSGMAFAFRAGVDYALTSKTSLAAKLDFDSSKEFDQGKLMLFLRSSLN